MRGGGGIVSQVAKAGRYSRRRASRWLVCPALVLLFAGAACRLAPAPKTVRAAEKSSPDLSKAASSRTGREVRATGTIRAVKEFMVLTPSITGQGGALTLTRLVATGARVSQGDIVAEFDLTKQLDNARDAKAKYDDLGFQVEQRQAENRSNAEKRT